jgi:glutathione S-transferase
MQLYSAGLSPFAARVRAAIYAKAVDIPIVAPPAAGTKSPEYLALNPMGKVPVLVLDDGSTLPESETIVEYLEDRFPQTPLRPATPEAAARARLVARVAELYVWPHLGGLFAHMNPQTRDQAVVDANMTKIREGLAHVDAFLDGGDFAVGERFSTADCWLVPVLFFVGVAGQTFGVGDLIAPHAKLSAYVKAMAGHPVAQRLTAEMQDALAAFGRR